MTFGAAWAQSARVRAGSRISRWHFALLAAGFAMLYGVFNEENIVALYVFLPLLGLGLALEPPFARPNWYDRLLPAVLGPNSLQTDIPRINTSGSSASKEDASEN